LRARYERIDVVAGRIMSYAGLRYYQHTTDAGRAKFMSDTQDKITTYTTALVFFTLEFNRIPDAGYETVFGSDPGCRATSRFSTGCGR
jgi:oligoendopeptidase F